MRTWIALSTLALALGVAPSPAAAGPDEVFGPLSFLVGEFRGRGEHPWGAYDETLTGEWINGRTALLVRSKSTLGGRTVFEDVRVVSFDAKAKRRRVRQLAMGDVATYDVEVRDDGTVVWEETAREGGALGPWRYTFTPRKDGEGFAYRVDQRAADGKWAPYVAGELTRRPPDAAEDGPLATRVVRASAPWAAEIHVPGGDGPFPLVVFSPGGDARTVEGYGGFGRRFASWGFAVAIVAFADSSATERAAKYGAVLDWMKKQEDLDVRFTACVAIAPAGPERLPTDAKHHPKTFLVVGDRDEFLATARKLHAALEGPRVLVTIAGMDHMCGPAERGRVMLARATAFLMARVAGEERFEKILTGEGDGVSVATGE